MLLRCVAPCGGGLSSGRGTWRAKWRAEVSGSAACFFLWCSKRSRGGGGGTTQSSLCEHSCLPSYRTASVCRVSRKQVVQRRSLRHRLRNVSASTEHPLARGMVIRVRETPKAPDPGSNDLPSPPPSDAEQGVLLGRLRGCSGGHRPVVLPHDRHHRGFAREVSHRGARPTLAGHLSPVLAFRVLSFLRLCVVECSTDVFFSPSSPPPRTNRLRPPAVWFCSMKFGSVFKHRKEPPPKNTCSKRLNGPMFSRRTFIGTWRSTFTGYITRLRGYYRFPAEFSWYFWDEGKQQYIPKCLAAVS